MNVPTEKLEWQDLILKTAKAVEGLERDLKTLSTHVAEIQGNDSSRFRERVARLEVAIEELSPEKVRLSDAQITKRIDNGIRIELEKRGITGDGGPVDAVGSVGGSVSPGGTGDVKLGDLGTP